MFSEARTARYLCATPAAQALRAAHKTYMLEKSEPAAQALCSYGSA